MVAEVKALIQKRGELMAKNPSEKMGPAGSVSGDPKEDSVPREVEDSKKAV